MIKHEYVFIFIVIIICIYIYIYIYICIIISFYIISCYTITFLYVTLSYYIVFSPPARWGLLDFIRAVLLLLLGYLSSSSSSSSSSPSSFSSTKSASTSTSTSALPTLRQALCQLSSPSSLPTSQLSVHWDLNLGPAQLSVHRWTSSSVCTAEGPSQLSVHRWTSTWDLPSPVCTAGPQPGICPAQCAPLDLNPGPPQLSVHCWTSTGR